MGISSVQVFFRITEWWRLEGTSGRHPVQPPLLQQVHLEPVAQDRVQMASEYLWGRRLHNLFGQPVPVLGDPHSEKVFPDVQRESSVFWCVHTASGPPRHHWKVAGSVFSAPSLQEFIYIDEIPLSLLFSRLNSPSSLSLPSHEMLKSLNHLCGPLLDSLCPCLSCTGELITGPSTPAVAPKVLNKGVGNVPWPAGNTSANEAQAVVGLLCSEGTLPAYVQLGVQQVPQVLFCKAAFHLGSPQVILVHGVVPPQVQLWSIKSPVLSGKIHFPPSGLRRYYPVTRNVL